MTEDVFVYVTRDDEANLRTLRNYVSYWEYTPNDPKPLDCEWGFLHMGQVRLRVLIQPVHRNIDELIKDLKKVVERYS